MLPALPSRVASGVAALASAVWLGGLLALGAIAAPVVFAVAPWPSNANAMTVVFRRFDGVAMTCAVVVLAAEAVRALSHKGFSRVDVVRIGASLLAAAGAVAEGTLVSPRIAELHQGGAIRGLGPAGIELASLHGWAERLGKAEVLLLALTIVLHASRPIEVAAGAGGGHPRGGRNVPANPPG
jgi:uncharacterized membrane protein